jgi:circadian clock protein KaiB
MNQEKPSNGGWNGEAGYRLILFVAGSEENSRTARRNLQHLCETDLDGRCHVEIVDVLEDVEKAIHYQILLTPTLLATKDDDEVMVIGNLNDRERVRTLLGFGGS